MKPGDVVGAQRWPYSAAHPDCWQPPWKGVVLDIEDPRAWANTLAFPADAPDPQAVRAHVAYCRANIPNAFARTVPVIWDFGQHGKKCHWEVVSGLRLYAEDYLDWLHKRSLAQTTQEDLAVFRASRAAAIYQRAT